MALVVREILLSACVSPGLHSLPRGAIVGSADRGSTGTEAATRALTLSKSRTKILFPNAKSHAVVSHPRICYVSSCAFPGA